MQWRQWCSKPKGRLSMALEIRSISHKRPKPFYQAAQCTGSRRVRTRKPETQKPRLPTHTIGRERHTAKIDARPVRLPSLARRVRTRATAIDDFPLPSFSRCVASPYVPARARRQTQARPLLHQVGLPGEEGNGTMSGFVHHKTTCLYRCGFNSSARRE
jgi:hypothetical protein